MPVTVTELAARRIDQIIQEHGFDPANMKLRVGVKGGGCSGFNYTLDLTEVQKDSDEAWSFTYARGAKAEVQGGGTATATAGHRRLRSQELPLPERHHDRLQGRDHGLWLRVQQPELDLDLRLRKQLQRVTGARARPGGIAPERARAGARNADQERRATHSRGVRPFSWPPRPAAKTNRRARVGAPVLTG